MIDRNGLRETFRQLNDDELRRRLVDGRLTEVAMEIAMEELNGRGLSFEPPSTVVHDEPPTLDKRASLETIVHYSTPLEAHMLKGLLEAEGIPAFVADEHLIQANWLWSNALGGVRVQVARECVLDAKNIMNAMAAGEYDVEIPGEEISNGMAANDQQPTCPHCSHNEVKAFVASRARALAMFYFFSLPMPFSRDRLKCERCGHVWTQTRSMRRSSGQSETSP